MPYGSSLSRCSRNTTEDSSDMFEALKKKLKGIFKRAPEVEELSGVYETPQEQKGAVTTSPEGAPPEEPLKEDAKEEPVLSRKERARLEKQEKAERKAEKKAAVVGDSGKKIKERTLDDLLWDLQLALLEADVAMPVAEEIRDGVRDSLLGKRHRRDHTLEEIVELSVKDAIRDVLKINEFDFDAWIETRNRPTSIMFIGINGTGKTTAIAKVAYRLIGQGKTVVMAAADTFRAGAIEQLTIHAERLECKIVKHSPDSDPAAVAFDAIEHAKAKRRDVVLIDTAGRMQTNNNLLDEMKKIVRVAKPDLKVFVGDSLAGNDAVEQARAFDKAVGVDAVILTKIDADSKGGAALSIAHTIGKPIAFVSNGQEYDKLIKFSTEWMVARLFD